MSEPLPSPESLRCFVEAARLLNARAARAGRGELTFAEPARRGR